MWSTTTVVLATLLPFVEIGVGLALVAGVATQAAAWVTLLMIMVFAWAVGMNLSRGRKIPCNCPGGGSGEMLGLVTLVRLGALGLMAAWLTQRPAIGWSLVGADLAVWVLAGSLVLCALMLLQLLPTAAMLLHEVAAVGPEHSVPDAVAEGREP